MQNPLKSNPPPNFYLATPCTVHRYYFPSLSFIINSWHLFRSQATWKKVFSDPANIMYHIQRNTVLHRRTQNWKRLMLHCHSACIRKPGRKIKGFVYEKISDKYGSCSSLLTMPDSYRNLKLCDWRTSQCYNNLDPWFMVHSALHQSRKLITIVQINKLYNKRRLLVEISARAKILFEIAAPSAPASQLVYDEQTDSTMNC